MENNKNILREETINFAIEISDICDDIKGCSVYVNQLLRCSSSIGANLHEAKYAQSRPDFINKLEIALKESFETEYWLELLYRKNKIDENTYKGLINKCGTIRRKLIASVTTVKNKQNDTKNTTKDESSQDTLQNKYDFIYDLENFYKENPKLLYPSIALKEHNLRKSGKIYNLNEHCKALILSKLSNRQKWQRIEEKLDIIQKIFFDYDCKKILERDEHYFIEQIKNIKCGSQVTDRDFSNLHQNIKKLIEIENVYGSVDNFLLSKPAFKIVEMLSDHSSALKMKTIGPALAWEYLRNVGIDGAKPDVHLKRILSPERLHISNNTNMSDYDFFTIMTDMKNKTNKSYAELDNFLWSYCADGQAKICTAEPNCSKCVIRKYCHRQ